MRRSHTFTFSLDRALAFAGIAFAVFAVVQGVNLYFSSQTSSELSEASDSLESATDQLDRIETGQRRIEVRVKPICTSPGLRDDCRKQLIAADEGRVADLCRLSAAVLNLAPEIEASCVVTTVRPEVQRGIGDAPAGSSESSQPTTTTVPSTPPGSSPEAPPGPQGPQGPAGPPGPSPPEPDDCIVDLLGICI